MSRCVYKPGEPIQLLLLSEKTSTLSVEVKMRFSICSLKVSTFQVGYFWPFSPWHTV